MPLTEKKLKGRKLYIHPMTQGGARLLASTFRSFGVDAHVLSPSDAETLELGAVYSSGDECLPKKITLGDILKITRVNGFIPEKTAFLMPTATGPCRFGQYWPSLASVLKKIGLDDIMIVSPSSSNGYEGIASDSNLFFRKAWTALVCSDILRKILLKTRPYEKVYGDTDKIYENSLKKIERTLEKPELNFSKHFKLIIGEMESIRTDFRNIEADYVRNKPLIAVVGEIFCRMNRFANEDMLRKIEEHGAETWIADVSEWIYYTDWTRMKNVARRRGKLDVEIFKTRIKNFVMRRDEHKLLKVFHEDFKGQEEPEDTITFAKYAEPYLPVMGALGEMSLSLGRSGYLYNKGVDGIVDISPFSCMNGIVSEAVYPSFSRDHNNLPCRVFYYDGINSDVDRDIGIFMELVKGYRSRKIIERVYPDYFD